MTTTTMGMNLAALGIEQPAAAAQSHLLRCSSARSAIGEPAGL